MTFSLVLQIYIEVDSCYVKYPDSMATWKVFIGEDHWFTQFETQLYPSAQRSSPQLQVVKHFFVPHTLPIYIAL